MDSARSDRVGVSGVHSIRYTAKPCRWVDGETVHGAVCLCAAVDSDWIHERNCAAR